MARRKIYATVEEGRGLFRMEGRCLQNRSRTPRPSLLGEALGLTGSIGRGQACWARRCQRYADHDLRLPPSGGALGLVTLQVHARGRLGLEPLLVLPNAPWAINALLVTARMRGWALVAPD